MTSDARRSLLGASERSPVSAWLHTATALLVACIIVIVIYYDTVSSAVYLWMHHATYGYAFAVLPVMAFLVWHDRSYFRVTLPTADPLGPLVAVPFAASWLVGAQLGILEIQHLALAGMLVALAITAIGFRHAAHFWLPLAYIFLLAPAGSPLLPYLQEIATRVAIVFLEIGQIPFYADGFSIEVATGNYLIAPGCAGLNFVLALATVAPLFVVIMYNSWTKRLIALALMMAIVPLANGFRVFAIIAIAEYTNRAIDIAADHLFYGWIFFSIVVLLMFWFGSRFADQPPPAAPENVRTTVPVTPANAAHARNLFVSLSLAAAICAAPAIYTSLQ